jgi:hypothetical protein
MAEENGSSVKSAIEVVAGIVKAVPVYDDAIQPAAKQVGKTLETVTKTVNMALAPIKALVWGYEQIESWITSRVAEKLKNVAEEHIVTPAPNVAGPAIEALRYAGHDEYLRELYANLIASAMDRNTADEVHPGFVEVLKNMNGDEAILLQAFIHRGGIPTLHINGRNPQYGFTIFKRHYNHLGKQLPLQKPAQVASYLDNLSRLGLLESPDGEHFADESLYIPLEIDPELDSVLAEIVDTGKTVELKRAVIRLTAFGAQFIKQVVVEKG